MIPWKVKVNVWMDDSLNEFWIRSYACTCVRWQWWHKRDPVAEQSITSFKDRHWNKHINTTASRMWRQIQFQCTPTTQASNEPILLIRLLYFYILKYVTIFKYKSGIVITKPVGITLVYFSGTHFLIWLLKSWRCRHNSNNCYYVYTHTRTPWGATSLYSCFSLHGPVIC